MILLLFKTPLSLRLHSVFVFVDLISYGVYQQTTFGSAVGSSVDFSTKVETDIYNRSTATRRQVHTYLSCSCKFLRALCHIGALDNFCHSASLIQKLQLCHIAAATSSPRGRSQATAGAVSGKLALFFNVLVALMFT